MADTGAIGPTANQTIAGMTAFSQAARLHRTSTGNGSAGFGGGNQGSVWTGIFSGDIPVGATINGFEITSETIQSVKGDVGTFGSSGASEEALFSFHLWNGTSLSAAIEMHDLNSSSGITYSSGNTLVNFVGANKRHPAGAPFGTYGDGSIMAGSPTELGGLSWTVSDQANFGFGIKVTTIVDTPTYGVERGIALKCYYTPLQLDGCTDPSATNYNASATDDDGSCVFPAPDPIYNTAAAMMSVTSGNISIDLGNIKIGS